MSRSEFVAKARNRAGADVVITTSGRSGSCEIYCNGCTYSSSGFGNKGEAIGEAQKHADACSFTA